MINSRLTNRNRAYLLCILIFIISGSCFTPIVQAMAATDWYDRSVELFKAGQYNAALDASNNAIALDPNYALAWNSKGAALVNLGRYDEALVASNKAIELDPNLAKAWNNKGLALDHLGRYEEALAAFNRAGEVDPAYTLSDVYRNILIKKISSTNNSQPPSSIPQTGSIYFTSSPFGASVYVDGSYKGTTPTTLSGHTTGSYTVRLTKTGYNDYSTTATVSAGQTTTVNGYLSQITESQPVAVAQPAYVQPAAVADQAAYVPPVTQNNRGSSDPSGLLIFLIIGVVVVVGGYIGYSKIIRSKKEKPPSLPAFTSHGANQVKTIETGISPSPSVDDEAIKILKLRYAKGEISVEKYDEMMEQLIK